MHRSGLAGDVGDKEAGGTEKIAKKAASGNRRASMLASICGVDIIRAALRLPAAARAPDEPYYIEVQHRGRRILLTFNRFKYRPPGYKTARWSSTESSAALVK